jgi:hypothetical protein
MFNKSERISPEMLNGLAPEYVRATSRVFLYRNRISDLPVSLMILLESESEILDIFSNC